MTFALHLIMPSKQITFRVPAELYEKIKESPDNPTDCIKNALHQYFEEPRKIGIDCNQDDSKMIDILQEQNKDLKKQLEDLTKTCENFPDPKIIEVMEDKTTILEEQLQISHQKYEDLQQIYTNYMLQIQTLIKQKKIEGQKKKWFEFWK